MSPRKIFMCTHDKSALEIAFSLKPQIEVVICADVSENRLPETKDNFSDYDNFKEMIYLLAVKEIN